jgi:hypothetical protein
MLGRLDEDLSCANSRLFRATLYANRDLSRFLRERFVLVWSSERPVPRVTIDFGDGRTVVRTLTGNSAHYVLDEDGEVLDVLPGLYTPAAFRRELERSLTLARQVREQSADARARLIADHHSQTASTAERAWVRLIPLVPGLQESRTGVRLEPLIVAAQRATFAKSAVELRDLRAIAKELAPEAIPETRIDTWSMAGRLLYGEDGPVLDPASRALVTRLHNAAPAELRAGRDDLDAMIARLEQTIGADTALNQLRIRPQISREIGRRGGRIEFDSLNAWIYDRVFRTPEQDPWLGLMPRDVFTGVPGDGVVSGSGS